MSTLAQRITDLATAVGADIKALQAAAGGGVALAPIYGYFYGASAAMVGTSRRVMGSGSTVIGIEAWCSGAATQAVTVSIKKNGADFTSQTIPSGALVASTPLALAIADGDYITADLSGPGATDVGFRLDLG